MKYLVVAFFGLLTVFSCTKIEDPADDPLHDNFPKIIFKPGNTEVNVVFQGVQRRFTVSVPADFSEKEAYPVVFAFKGNLESADIWIQELTPFIEARDYIGIYPESKDGKWNLGVGETKPDEDLLFVNAIINAIKSTGNVDTERIFAMGVSNGGCMSHYLALETNHFAAIASIAGSLYEGLSLTPVNPVSVLQIHGKLDQSVPYEGGATHGFVFKSAYNSASTWAQLNGCDSNPTTDTSLEGAVIYNFNHCDEEVETILFSVPEAGHAVYSEYDNINLTAYIFDFFGRHTK